MLEGYLYALAMITALLCGLMAGAFFVFSVMVMPGLARLQPAQGIAAMQAINIAAVRPWFMTAFFLPALLSVALIIAAIANWGADEALVVLAGSALYLVGGIGLTAGFHVPRNNALAAVDPNSAHAAAHWAGYLSSWTIGNHVRATASLAAAALLTFALMI